MKNIIVLANFFVCVLILSSCKKTNSVPLNLQLTGSWELRILYGGQGPGSGPYYPPGNGDIWKFTDSFYSRYANGQIVSSGFYTLTKAKAFDSEVPEDALILNYDTTNKLNFDIMGDTLTMYVGSVGADGYIAKYVRQ